MGEPCPSYTDEQGFHPADGRAWSENFTRGFPEATVSITDYRPHPDACVPLCENCVPCLKTLLAAAQMWW